MTFSMCHHPRITLTVVLLVFGVPTAAIGQGEPDGSPCEPPILQAPPDRAVLESSSAAAEARRAEGNLRDAAWLGMEVLGGFNRLLGPTHARTITAMEHLAAIYEDLGEPQTARSIWTDAYELRRDRGERSAELVSARHRAAELSMELDDHEAAAELWFATLADLSACEELHRQARFSLALALYSLDRSEDALPFASASIRERSKSGPDEDLLAAMLLVALLETDLGRIEHADLAWARAVVVNHGLGCEVCDLAMKRVAEVITRKAREMSGG